MNEGLANVAAGRLKFTTSTEEGVANGEVVFIAVVDDAKHDEAAAVFDLDVGREAHDRCVCVLQHVGERLFDDAADVVALLGREGHLAGQLARAPFERR